MPVTLLDLVVIGVVLVSALLAAVRGLTREVLAIASWAAAAIVAWIFHPQLLPFAQQHIPNKTVALVVVIAGLFLATLIIVSLITARISDFVLDSRIGALDRTLGFVFGAGRGGCIRSSGNVSLIFSIVASCRVAQGGDNNAGGGGLACGGAHGHGPLWRTVHRVRGELRRGGPRGARCVGA